MNDKEKQTKDNQTEHSIPSRNLSLEKANQAIGRQTKTMMIMALGMALLSAKILMTDDIVRLVPPGMTSEAAIGSRSADADYLQSFGLYVATLSANISPKNAPFVADTLSKLVAPDVYPVIRKQVLAYANDPAMMASGAATRFDASGAIYEPSTNKVFVMGNFQVISSHGVGQPQPTVYELTISMRNGRPWVTGVDYYAGSEPHTKKWHELHPPVPAGDANSNQKVN